jgi:hypothetical protein
LNNNTKQVEQKEEDINTNKSNLIGYEKIMEIIDNKHVYDDTIIFKKALKYLLRFDSKSSKIYRIS